MDDAQLMVLELGSKGYSCAQMVVIGGLRLMGRENPDLTRSLAGLAQGVAGSGGVCGALAGGACLIGLHTGKGLDNEDALPEGAVIMEALTDWFREELCKGGDITCDAILGCDGSAGCRGMDAVRCGNLVGQTWTRAVSLLVENGLDPTMGRDND